MGARRVEVRSVHLQWTTLYGPPLQAMAVVCYGVWPRHPHE